MFLFGLFASLNLAAQKSGGENQNPFGHKKKEKKNQRASRSSKGSIFKRKSSKGNADAFASNSIRGKRGFLAGIFGGNKSKNASLRKSKPGKVQEREQSRLFRKNSTAKKNGHRATQKKQNRSRSNKRTRGNAVFAKKKR